LEAAGINLQMALMKFSYHLILFPNLSILEKSKIQRKRLFEDELIGQRYETLQRSFLRASCGSFKVLSAEMEMQ
jgi:hypothetical protein